MKIKAIVTCLAVTCLAVTSWAQTKISALPTVSSISGSELVPLVQSGATKTATVNQIILSAATAAANAQTYAQNVAATNNAATANLTNDVTAEATARAAALVATNLLVQQAIASFRPSSTTNGLTTIYVLTNLDNTTSLVISNAGTAHPTIIGGALGTIDFVVSNHVQTVLFTNTTGISYGTNSAGAVTAFIGTNNFSSGGIQPGANATLGTVTVTNYSTPSLSLPLLTVANTSQTYWVDCSKNNNQILPLTGTGSAFVGVGLSNWVDGQTITLLVPVQSGSGTVGINAKGATASPGTGNFIGSSSSVNEASGHFYYMNWVIIGGNVIYSGADLGL